MVGEDDQREKTKKSIDSTCAYLAHIAPILRIRAALKMAPAHPGPGPHQVLSPDGRSRGR